MALPPIPAGLVCYYNGITFPSSIKTKVEEEPIESGDGRVIKYSRITFAISGYVTMNEAGTVQGSALVLVGDGILGSPVITGIAPSTTGLAVGQSVTGPLLPAGTTILSIDSQTQITLSQNQITLTGAQDLTFAAYDSNIPIPIDALMRTWRTSLQKNGKTLIYQNKGYGVDLVINAPGGTGVRDVAMGPKAGKFSWEPLGGAPVGCIAAKFSWSVSTCIPECTNATYLPGEGVFSEISFTKSYSEDEAGLSTIVTSGTIEIPLSLQLNNTLTTNVDQWFDDAITAVPTGFIRTATRQISADRRSCSFTLTDKQIEICYPTSVVFIDMDHTVKDVGVKGFIGLGRQWACKISGTVRMDPTVPKSWAFARFWAICWSRINDTRQSLMQLAAGTANAAASRNWVLPPILEMTEKLFKNESRFSLSYRIMGGATLRNILKVSGLWRRLPPPPGVQPNAVFAAWSQSLWLNAQASGGILETGFGTNEEVIIDVCSTAANVAVGGTDAAVDPGSIAVSAGSELGPTTTQYAPINLLGGNDESGFSSTSDIPAVAFEGPDDIDAGGKGTSAQLDSVESGVIAPDPESSWLNWVCEVEADVDFKMVRHKPLSGTATTDVPTIDPLGDVNDVLGDDSPPTIGFESSVPDIVQQICSPSITLTLRGNATRVLYRVNPPLLVSFGGNSDQVLARKRVKETVLAAPGGLTLYRLDWELVYIVPQPPQTISVPASPFLGTDGQE